MQGYLSDLVLPYYRKLGWIENVQTDLWTDRYKYRIYLLLYPCFIHIYKKYENL